MSVNLSAQPSFSCPISVSQITISEFKPGFPAHLWTTKTVIEKAQTALEKTRYTMQMMERENLSKRTHDLLMESFSKKCAALERQIEESQAKFNSSCRAFNAQHKLA